MSLSTGDKLGPYEILAPLGKGGMGQASPDGQRFLMLKAPEQAQAPAQINVVLNWFEELKRRVPSGKN